ncbi:MAG: hypothetical protein M0P23_02620 [Bacteroidales bacterium]|jgi:preprotein translocase subunit SecB|nr:hypothetical protein [Bacteroidales bacterium]
MIAKKSDLILTGFTVVKNYISFKPDSERQENILPKDYFDEYLVNLDFDVQHNNEHDVFRVIVAVNINTKESQKDILPGYSIQITGIAFFKFSQEARLGDEQKSQMLNNSGLSICITNLRSFIYNQTASFPWGPYSFYAIDVNDLLAQKQNEVTSSPDYYKEPEISENEK